MKDDKPPSKRRSIPVIQASVAPYQEGIGHPIAGFMTTESGEYLATINGVIEGKIEFEPKKITKRGRHKADKDRMERYCAFLIEWADPIKNPTGKHKHDAFLTAARKLMKTGTEENIIRSFRRDEKECMGWLEVIVRFQNGKAPEVVIYPDVPQVTEIDGQLCITGAAWRYANQECRYGNTELKATIRNLMIADFAGSLIAERSILHFVFGSLLG